MRFQTTRELLDHVREFHHQAGSYYQTLSQGRDLKRVKIMLDYMAKHEKQLAEALQRYETEADPALLNAWFDEAPEINLGEALENLKLHDGMDVEDVLRLGLHLGDYLILAFDYLAEHAEDDDVRDAFQNLSSMAQADKRRLVRDSNMMQDI